MERFTLGLDYPEQRDAANLGFRLEQNTLILRYAIYPGLVDFTATPVWTENIES